MKQKDLWFTANLISKRYKTFGNPQNDGSVHYFFDKFQTEENLHNKFSGDLLEIGIQAEVLIKIGRGRHNKGNRYATVILRPELVTKVKSLDEVFTEKLNEKFGISADYVRTEKGIVLNFQSGHTANTLLRAFRHHKPVVVAHSYLDYSMFIPVQPELLLNS